MAMPMAPEAAPPEAPVAPEAEGNPEDVIIDQIGELMSQLAPESQQAVLAKLAELAGGGESAEPVGTSSPEGGPNGVPLGV